MAEGQRKNGSDFKLNLIVKRQNVYKINTKPSLKRKFS